MKRMTKSQRKEIKLEEQGAAETTVFIPTHWETNKNNIKNREEMPKLTLEREPKSQRRIGRV